MLRRALILMVLALGTPALVVAQQPPAQADPAIQEPTLKTYFEPVYPDEARLAGVVGSVIVEAGIDATGAVVSTKILKSVPLLDQAAVNAVSRWTFNPATMNGVPIERLKTVTVTFPNVVRVGGTIRAPTKIRDAAPVYPPAARASGVQGIVILELTLGVDGTVAEARVLKSVDGLDEAALAAVQQWVFTPTLLNGVPVRVLYNVTVPSRRAERPLE